MAGNWGKRSGNFAGRVASTGQYVNAAPKNPNRSFPKTEAAGSIVHRVSEALRSANEKTGFVRTDAKK